MTHRNFCVWQRLQAERIFLQDLPGVRLDPSSTEAGTAEVSVTKSISSIDGRSSETQEANLCHLQSEQLQNVLKAAYACVPTAVAA